jgi:hypothetical protein
MQDNINHKKSTAYVKAIYLKLQGDILHYKAQSAASDSPFDFSYRQAEALEKSIEELNLKKYYESILALEEEAKQQNKPR